MHWIFRRSLEIGIAKDKIFIVRFYRRSSTICSYVGAFLTTDSNGSSDFGYYEIHFNYGKGKYVVESMYLSFLFGKVSDNLSDNSLKLALCNAQDVTDFAFQMGYTFK